MSRVDINRVLSRSNHNSYSLNVALNIIKQSRSFQHLRDDVILGLIKFYIERQFETRERDKYIPAHSVTETCGKCKGRGWFGRGRPTCPACGGDKEIMTHVPAKWKIHKNDNLRGTWACEIFMDLELPYPSHPFGFSREGFDFWSRKSVPAKPKRIHRYGECVYNTISVYPKWINSLKLTDESVISESEAIDSIKIRFEEQERNPLIRHDVFDNLTLRYLFKDVIDYDATVSVVASMQKLAKAYGVTCPITGGWTPPNQLRMIDMSDKYGYRYPDNLLPHPWGMDFNIHIIDRSVVYSLSEKGEKILNRAIRKWKKEFPDDSPSDEWLMAEIMDKELIPQAHKTMLAA